MTASLGLKIFFPYMRFWIYVFVKSIVSLPISVLKTSVGIGSDFEIGSYNLCSPFYYFTNMCILLFICFYAFDCMSAILYIINIVLHVNVGFGIMLMTLPSWFDLVLGLDVYNVDGSAAIHLFMISNCNTNSVSICKNCNYILPLRGAVLYVVNDGSLYVYQCM